MDVSSPKYFQSLNKKPKHSQYMDVLSQKHFQSLNKQKSVWKSPLPQCLHETSCHQTTRNAWHLCHTSKVLFLQLLLLSSCNYSCYIIFFAEAPDNKFFQPLIYLFLFSHWLFSSFFTESKWFCWNQNSNLVEICEILENQLCCR